MKNKELNNIKSPGFNLPDGYFESFDEKVLGKLDQESSLKNRSTGFKIPKDYFNTFENNIVNEISEQNNTKVISIFNKKNITYVASIAAAVLLLFNLSVFDNTPSFDNLQIESVEDYLIDENVSSYEIASLLSEEDINENITIDLEFDEENIEAYLLEHADIETLMIE